MRLHQVITCLLVAAVLLPSCSLQQRQALSCNQIIVPQLRAVPFHTLDKTTGGSWIKANFAGGDLDDMGVGPDYRWSYNAQKYVASFDSTYKSIVVSFSEEPIVSEVLDCFGEPSLYRIARTMAEKPGVEFTMWYPSQGLVFRFTGFGERAAQGYSGSSSLNELFITQPGPTSTIAPKIYSESFVREVLSSLRPWPDSFDRVQLQNQ